MMQRKGRAGLVVTLAVVLAGAVACATSAPGTPMAATDLAALAGQWRGWVTLPGGSSTPGTLDLSPSGDYVAQTGAFTARGVAQVKNGALTLTSTSGTGALGTGERTSSAALFQAPDGTLVLRGSGRGDAGPFDFEVRRAK